MEKSRLGVQAAQMMPQCSNTARLMHASPRADGPVLAAAELRSNGWGGWDGSGRVDRVIHRSTVQWMGGLGWIGSGGSGDSQIIQMW